MIGASSVTKTMVRITLAREPEAAAEHAPQIAARVSTSIMVAMLGANHIASTRARTAIPASERMKSAGVGASATAALPISSMPIQAGEPMNIRIAKAS